MDSTQRQGTWTPAAKIALAVLAGLVVLVLLFPEGGVDTQPPHCYSVFYYNVPCDAGWALAAGVAMFGVVGLLLWTTARRTSGD